MATHIARTVIGDVLLPLPFVICAEGLQETFRNARCSFGSLCKVFVICRGYCYVGVLTRVWFYMCLHGTSKSILRWSVLYTCNYIHTREQTHYTHAHTDTYIHNACVGIVAVSAVKRLKLLFLAVMALFYNFT